MSKVDRCVGVQVSDEEGYQRYRDAMMPLLLECGGLFLLDVRVSEVLKAPQDGRFNRLFIIRFPDAETASGFFTTEAYVAIRDALFSPSVSSVTMISKSVVASA